MSALERYVQAKQLSSYFMRLNISQNSIPANINNSCGDLQLDQRPREAANNNNTSEIHSPPKALTPRATQSLLTELRRKRKHYQNRVQPYAFAGHVKARKSLKF